MIGSQKRNNNVQKMEIIVMCELFCLSRPALDEQLKQLTNQVPEFFYRYAQNAELIELVQKYSLKMMPCLLIGEQILYGVPKQYEILSAWKNLSGS